MLESKQPWTAMSQSDLPILRWVPTSITDGIGQRVDTTHFRELNRINLCLQVFPWKQIINNDDSLQTYYPLMSCRYAKELPV